MNVNIYYGGRGMVGDPTIFVINKIQEVLLELKVKVNRYDLYELKNTITTLPQTLKEADAVVLATTVEWFGIGGYMQEFLDACWLYADKGKIETQYMFPVVTAKTYGEQEAWMTLVRAWETLGGKTANGLKAYIDEDSGFEFDDDYISVIERMSENIYRTVSQKTKSFPSSSTAVTKTMLKETIKLTPQEGEQLSKFVADDNFVAKQKKDIEELAGMFKEMLGDQERGGDDYYVSSLMEHFAGKSGFEATYVLIIEDKNKNVNISVNGKEIQVAVGEKREADVIGKLNQTIFDDIIYGRMTFQRAFMAGDMTAKGNFKTLRMLDEIFKF